MGLNEEEGSNKRNILVMSGVSARATEGPCVCVCACVEMVL